jgi:hypothetical protein
MRLLDFQGFRPRPWTIWTHLARHLLPGPLPRESSPTQKGGTRGHPRLLEDLSSRRLRDQHLPPSALRADDATTGARVSLPLLDLRRAPRRHPRVRAGRARDLPQLPLMLNPERELLASGEFLEQIGPSYLRIRKDVVDGGSSAPSASSTIASASRRACASCCATSSPTTGRSCSARSPSTRSWCSWARASS